MPLYTVKNKPKAYTNLRTEAAWKLRRRLDLERHTDDRYPVSSRQPPFHIPPRASWMLLREDLEALSYDLIGGKIRLISNEDMCIQRGCIRYRYGDVLNSFAFD